MKFISFNISFIYLKFSIWNIYFLKKLKDIDSRRTFSLSLNKTSKFSLSYFLHWMDGFESNFDSKSLIFIFFFLYFNLNKWFSDISKFFSSWFCLPSAVLFHVLLQYSFGSYWKNIYWFECQRCISETLYILVTLILSYYL